MKTLDPKAEYVVKNGKPTAVILPLEEYEELLEDLHDMAVIARRQGMRLPVYHGCDLKAARTSAGCPEVSPYRSQTALSENFFQSALKRGVAETRSNRD
jgi:hypothetical protein